VSGRKNPPWERSGLFDRKPPLSKNLGGRIGSGKKKGLLRKDVLPNFGGEGAAGTDLGIRSQGGKKKKGGGGDPWIVPKRERFP